MTIEPRDRRTHRINRARLKLELRRSRRPLAVLGGFALIALLLTGYIVRNVSKTALRSTYEARFEVADATGIQPGLHEVRFKGIPAGTITQLDFEDNRPVVTVKLLSKYGRLYRDVKAQLRPNTALQDMYLDIVDRGTQAAGVLDQRDPVPASQTTIPVRVDEVLNLFRSNQRTRLRTLLDDLGNGMEDGGRNLRAIFVEAVPLLEVAGRISANLRARAPMVRRLVHNSALLTRDLATHEQQLRTVVRAGSATLGTLQDGAADLDMTLRGLPPTLDELRSSFTYVRGVLGDVDGAVRTLYPVARELPTSLAAVRELSDAARPAVEALRKPVRRLVPLAQTLPPVTSGLNLAIDRLLPQIDTLDHVTTGAAGCKKGIQGFFQWNASMSKFGDSRSPVPRGNAVMGAQSSGFLSDPNEYAPQACVPGGPITGRVPTPEDGH